MKKNTRNIAIVGALALTGIVGITAAASGGESSWQDQVRASVQAEWDASPDAENQDACDSMEMFGLTDADSMTEFALSFGSENVDLADMGIDESILADASLENVVHVGSEAIIANCDF